MGLDRGSSAVSGQHCSGFGADGYYSVWFNLAFNVTLLKSFFGVLFTKTKEEKENKPKTAEDLLRYSMFGDAGPLKPKDVKEIKKIVN